MSSFFRAHPFSVRGLSVIMFFNVCLLKVVRAQVVALQTGVAANVKVTDRGEKWVVIVDRVVSVKIVQTSPMFNTNF
jgi:hypothetical protein